MRLIPLPESKLESLRPICERVKTEYSFGDTYSPEQAFLVVQSGYENRRLAVYVDNVDDIKHCVIMTHSVSMISEGVTAYVLFIYSVPEHRGSQESLDAMKQIVEGYAQVQGASKISGSSWVLFNHKSMDALWKKWGYQPQETVYSKFL